MATCPHCTHQRFLWDGVTIVCMHCRLPLRIIYQQWQFFELERMVRLSLQADPSYSAEPLAEVVMPYESRDIEQRYYEISLFHHAHLGYSLQVRGILPAQYVRSLGRVFYFDRIPICAHNTNYAYDGISRTISYEFRSELISPPEIDVSILASEPQWVVHDGCPPPNRPLNFPSRCTKAITALSSDILITSEIYREQPREDRVEVTTFGSEFAEEVVIRRYAEDYFRRKARPDACTGCANYYGQAHGGNMLVCAMHPYGWTDSDQCPDREEKPQLQIQSTPRNDPSVFEMNVSLGHAVSRHYTLNRHTRQVEPCTSLEIWSHWYENADRRIAETTIGLESADLQTIIEVRISTVFLGLDHGMGDRPILFETMVSGGDFDGDQERYSTWDEAEAGHQEILSLIAASFDRPT